MLASSGWVARQHGRFTRFWGTKKIGCLWIASSHWQSVVTSFHPDLYREAMRLLVQARKDAGITQQELATRIGQRQTFVSKFELGERRLDAAEFVRVGRAIGTDPYRLLRKAETAVGVR